MRTGESIFASIAPFVSMLHSMLIEEIIESIVVLLLVIDLGLHLLFASIIVHPWSLVFLFIFLSYCLLHIFASYSFFLFLIKFYTDFSKLTAVSVDPKDSLAY
jgi:hypothetical protein